MPSKISTTSLLYEQNPIVEKSFEFAIQVVAYSEDLESKRKFVIARQIIRSGFYRGKC